MLTNAGGTWFAMKYEIPHMRQQGSGVIINMASVAGHRGFPIHSLQRLQARGHRHESVAVVNAQHNIRVNSISPSWSRPNSSILAAEGITYKQAAASFVTPNHEHGRDGARRHLMRRRA